MTFVLQRCDISNFEEPRGGFGALSTNDGNLPLKQLWYHARLVGLTVRTTILQTYYNPFDEPIEATYIFPIEGQQAVVDCELRVGGRVVRARLKERGEARQDYNRAIRAGHRAALLEENRPETFAMKVGNIAPGEAVQVCIETVGQIDVVHGEWTLRLPLVVAPRYTSGIALPSSQLANSQLANSDLPRQARSGSSAGPGTARDTDQVPDASTITPPTWLPGFASPVDLRLAVEINLAQLAYPNWINDLQSSLHSVLVNSEPNVPANCATNAATSNCNIQVLPGERVDRDFILRGRVAAEQPVCSLVMESSKPDSSLATASPTITTVAVSIVPPTVTQTTPRDIVFVLDRSGSMSGWKMKAARRGLSRLIDSLLPEDRFQLLAFDDTIDAYCGTSRSINIGWQVGTDSNRYEAVRWLAQVDSRGGTELGAALEHAFIPFRDLNGQDVGRSRAIVLVTDGQITGEDSLLRILGTIPAASRPRLFCLGIDKAVNASVMQRLTKFTSGTFELVESEKRLDKVLSTFADEIGAPALSNVQIECGPNYTAEFAPTNVQSLYSGRSLTLFARLNPTSEPTVARDHESLSVTVRGLLPNGETWKEVVEARVPDGSQPESVAKPILLPLWGKARVRELEDEFIAGGNRRTELHQAIIDHSLTCRVLSRYTAFVAVDETEKISQGERPHAIVQPSEIPEGWESYLVTLDRSSLIPRARRQSGVTSASGTPDAMLRKLVTESLLRQNIISEEQLSESKSLATQQGCSISTMLVRLGYVTERQVAIEVAVQTRMNFVDISSMQVDASIVQTIPESVARENCVFPIAESNGALRVAIDDPNNLEVIEKLRFILNRRIEVVIASQADITDAINLYYGQIEGESADSCLQEFTDTQIDFTEIESTLAVVDDLSDESTSFGFAKPSEPTSGLFAADLHDLFDEVDAAPARFFAMRRSVTRKKVPSESPVVRLVAQLFAEAVQLKATHILLSVEKKSFSVCYLVNGKLVKRDSHNVRLLAALITHILILAKLDISIRDQLQSGQLTYSVNDQQVNAVVFVKHPDLLIDLGTCAGAEPVEVQQWRERVK